MLALAAFAFAACSQDDDINTNPEPIPGEKGALVESISINFGEGSQKPGTRAYGEDQKGEGTEGMIYEAFIFAKEANPLHDRALTGDWTVIRITRGDDGTLVQEIGGINPEATTKADLKKAVNEGSDENKEWLVKNVASFKGVRQGDYVYVIANDPNLTLAQAATMAHQGDQSEEKIKAYTASISKEYLSKLTYYPETGKATDNNLKPNGRFVMAGRELIPVSPTIPSNGNIDLTIGMDRELSKVNFTALVSTDPDDVAYGKVEFQKGDGIVVARIARKTSMFTEKTGDWYVPATTCVENWPINDHSLTDNLYNSLCDATFDGSKVFDGESATPITDWITGTTIPAGFNTANPASNISEYRYSWKVLGNPGTKEKPIYIDAASNGKLVSPMFYVTPNYSNNTNSVTVICTQATYTGRGVFANSNMIDTYVDAALNETKEKIVIFTAAETSGDALEIENPLVYEAATAATLNKNDILAKVKVAVSNWGIKMFDTEAKYNAAKDALTGTDKTAWESTTTPTFAEYKTMMDRFYVAVLLQQRLANKGAGKVGNQSSSADKTNWGNGIATGKTGYYINADTDSLLIGHKKLDDGTIVNRAFYFSADMSEASAQGMLADAMFMPASPVAGAASTGAEVRAAYFAGTDAFEYFKGQKLYYRADIANYVAGVSNKITERNMYYVSTGTIQSLGAKSIHDAIYSDQNTMSVNVYVKNWKFSQNNIPM